MSHVNKLCQRAIPNCLLMNNCNQLCDQFMREVNKEIALLKTIQFNPYYKNEILNNDIAYIWNFICLEACPVCHNTSFYISLFSNRFNNPVGTREMLNPHKVLLDDNEPLYNEMYICCDKCMNYICVDIDYQTVNNHIGWLSNARLNRSEMQYNMEYHQAVKFLLHLFSSKNILSRIFHT